MSTTYSDVAAVLSSGNKTIQGNLQINGTCTLIKEVNNFNNRIKNLPPNTLIDMQLLFS
jgi:hypothetical protein